MNSTHPIHNTICIETYSGSSVNTTDSFYSASKNKKDFDELLKKKMLMKALR